MGTTATARKSTTSRKPTAPSRAARNNPVTRAPRDVMHAGDIKLPGDDVVADLKGVATEVGATIAANGGDVKRLLSGEAFMNEYLLIMVANGGENEPPIAQVIVNNRAFDIPRGRLVRVRRFVVEALAHAKQANFKTKRSRPGDPTHMQTTENSHFSYTFSVQEDPSGVEGFKWLEKVLNDPN